MVVMNTILAVVAAMLGAQPGLPTVTVTQDDTVIERSCRVTIPRGRVIADANGDGVIHIRGDDITVEFVVDQGTLAGAPEGTSWDELTGVGIRIDGRRNVTLRNARAIRFKVGIWASNADGLTLEACDISDGFAQRLRSTPLAEDGSDWLWPHNNDNREWMNNYGAGIYVERSSGVTIRDAVARRRQNGIILDRVTDSRIFDNDCSFLSGWGLAMWRSSRNVISRNAFDFCVRGYSHGVYNRGQDSAGILVFEQNNGNVFAENSATHGGDGFFGFAGREALGEAPAPTAAFEYRRRGNNDNLLVGNDFSYAPAHGIEMTFSFGNRFIGNRLVKNAICGVWGGYSQDTLIAENHFEGNGEMAYGLERGGINIEHGAGNQILNNIFRDNKAGVHLWWDADEGLMKTPWAKANHRGTGSRMLPSAQNTVAENLFDGDTVALHLRECDSTTIAGNTYREVGKIVDATPGSEPTEMQVAVSWAKPEYPVFGDRKPVGARSHLAGRDKIVMTEWFPWDHEGPLVRLAHTGNDSHVYELHNLPASAARISGLGLRLEPEHPGHAGGPVRLAVIGAGPGVRPYTLRIVHPGYTAEFPGVIVNTDWDVVFFPWTGEAGKPVPPPDLAEWRAQAESAGAVRIRSPRLSFKYAGGGPSDVVSDDAVKAAKFRGDYFGMIARTTLPLPKGTWRIRTLSDDGVRVQVDGKTVLENWTHHGPTRDSAEFEVPLARSVAITVEHFEIFGYAVLEFEIEPVR